MVTGSSRLVPPSLHSRETVVLLGSRLDAPSIWVKICLQAHLLSLSFSLHLQHVGMICMGCTTTQECPLHHLHPASPVCVCVRKTAFSMSCSAARSSFVTFVNARAFSDDPVETCLLDVGTSMSISECRGDIGLQRRPLLVQLLP